MELNEDIRIRRLLEVYFEGTASLDEERLLREYFASGSVADDLLYAKPLFAFFDGAAADRYDGAAIGTVFGDSMGSVDTAQARHSVPLPRAKRRRGAILYSAVATAAVIAIAIGTYMFSGRQERPRIYCYLNGKPVTNVAVAMRQAALADRVLSIGMQAGVESAAAVETVGNSFNTLNAAIKLLETVGAGGSGDVPVNSSDSQ